MCRAEDDKCEYCCDDEYEEDIVSELTRRGGELILSIESISHTILRKCRNDLESIRESTDICTRREGDEKVLLES